MSGAAWESCSSSCGQVSECPLLWGLGLLYPPGLMVSITQHFSLLLVVVIVAGQQCDCITKFPREVMWGGLSVVKLHGDLTVS